MIPCKVLEIKAQSQLHSKMVAIHHGWPCLTPWSDVPYTIIALASSYCLFRLREVTICLGSKWIIYDEPILWCPRVQDAHLTACPKHFWSCQIVYMPSNWPIYVSEAGYTSRFILQIPSGTTSYHHYPSKELFIARSPL